MISPRAAGVVAGEAQPRAALAVTLEGGCAVLAVSFWRPYSVRREPRSGTASW